MSTCNVCGQSVTSLPQHTTDCHSTPPDMVINGKLTRFVREGSDDAIVCPIPNCKKRYTRRSNFLRHLRDDEKLLSPVPKSNGKRSLGPSLENVSQRARKKTKIAAEKFREVIKKVQPRLTMSRVVKSSDISSEGNSPQLSSSLPTSPCPVRGEAAALWQSTATASTFGKNNGNNNGSGNNNSNGTSVKDTGRDNNNGNNNGNGTSVKDTGRDNNNGNKNGNGISVKDSRRDNNNGIDTEHHIQLGTIGSNDKENSMDIDRSTSSGSKRKKRKSKARKQPMISSQGTNQTNGFGKETAESGKILYPMTSFRVDNFPGKGNGTAANEMAISSNSAKDDGKEKVASKDKGKQKAMNESQKDQVKEYFYNNGAAQLERLNLPALNTTRDRYLASKKGLDLDPMIAEYSNLAAWEKDKGKDKGDGDSSTHAHSLQDGQVIESFTQPPEHYPVEATDGRMILDGTRRYLAACKDFAPLGVAVHRLLCVLICLSCKCCFLPRDMPGHLKKHGLIVADREKFTTACKRWKIHEDYDDVLIPSPRGPPVEAVDVYDGYACAVDPATCSFACTSKEWMEKHCREHPDRPIVSSSCYRSKVKIQNLFPANRKFFETEPALWNVPQESVFSVVLQKLLPALPVPSIAAPDPAYERDALLRLTQWDVIMEPYYTDSAKHRAIQSLKESPRQGDPAFRALHDAMQDYIRLGMKIGRTVSPNITVRKHLVQGRILSSVPLPTDRDTYWVPLPDNESPAAYAAMGEEFLRVFLRCSQGHSSAFEMPVTPTQQQLAVALYEALLSDRDTVPSALHALLWDLIRARTDMVESTMASCPFQSWFAVHALKPDATFINSDDLAQLLAKVKYLAKNIGMVEAHRRQATHPNGIIGATIDVHEEALALGLNAPYNSIFELQQFTSSLSYNQTRTPKLFWSDKMDRVTISGQTLILSKFRSGIQDLIRDTSSMMDTLTGGKRFVTALPENMRDDLPNTTRGYSWLSHGPFTEVPHAYLSHLMQNSDWEFAFLNDTGGLSWNVPALCEIMDKFSQVNAMLMFLNHLFGDNRGTQLADQQIRNAFQPRNLHYALSSMFWLTRRTKTSNITGTDACIPTFIPEMVEDLMLIYLAGGMREAEEIFAHILYGKESASLYHTYMWVQNGKRVDSGTFSDSIMQPLTSKYFGAQIGIRNFRQVKISMIREFIPASLHLGGGDTIADIASDHSQTIARTRYGLNVGDLPHLTEDLIWEHRVYNREWFTFCGLGPLPPQEPLRLIRQTSLTAPSASLRSKPSDDTPLTDIVQRTIDAALDKAIPRAFRRMEREVLDDLLPALVESAVEAILRKRNHLDDDQPTPQSNQDTEIISISSDHDAISISSDGNFIDDAALEDEEEDDSDYYGESDDDEDEDEDEDPGNRGRRRGGSGRRGGEDGGNGGGGGGCGKGGGGGGRRGGRDGFGGGRKGGGERRARDVQAETSRAGALRGHGGQSDSLDVMATIHNFEREIEDESSLPPTPSPLLSSLEARAREAIRRAIGPDAVPKSPEQLELLVTAIENKRDGIFVIPTGGGKSLAWDGTATVEDGCASVVMVPYAPLLDQHLQASLRRGIVAHKYTVSSPPPDDYQILYIQPETGNTTNFKEFMVSPKGSRVRRLILDEWHEFGLHHPERGATFRKFGVICASLNVQCIFLTASYPHHLHKVFCNMAHISTTIPVIRASTDRPTLGYHFLSIDTGKASISEATRRLVYACEATLRLDERMIVFYKDQGSAESFAKQNRCAVYHSQLPTNGNNTKGYNLWLWDSGQTKVIAATTALLQGTDRPYIKYVIFCDLPYGEISYHQGGGRGGRAGEPAYVFVLFPKKTVFIRPSGSKSSKDVQCYSGLIDLVENEVLCSRGLLTLHMDGAKLQRKCSDVPGSNSCHVCDPDSETAVFARKALLTIPSNTARLGFGAGDRVDANAFPVGGAANEPSGVPKAPSTTRSRTVNNVPANACPPSDDYGSDVFTPSMAEAMDNIERSFSHTIASSQPHSTTGQLAPATPTQNSYLVRTLPASVPINRVRTHYAPFASSPLATVSSNSIHQRQEAAISAQQRRMATSAKISTFMSILKGTCPACFTCFGTLVNHPVFDGCPSEMNVPRHQWITFKRSFRFAAFTYCYYCGLPQDRGSIKESPACHRNLTWGKGVFCPWADYIFIVLWCIWNKENLRSPFLAANQLDANTVYDQFVDWATEEDAVSGEYYKGLEGFVGFCERWMASGRRTGNHV